MKNNRKSSPENNGAALKFLVNIGLITYNQIEISFEIL